MTEQTSEVGRRSGATRSTFKVKPTVVGAKGERALRARAVAKGMPTRARAKPTVVGAQPTVVGAKPTVVRAILTLVGHCGRLSIEASMGRVPQ